MENKVALFKGPLSVSTLSSPQSTRIHSREPRTFTLVIEGHKGHQVDAAQAAQDEVPRVKDTRPIIPVFAGHGLRFTNHDRYTWDDTQSW